MCTIFEHCPNVYTVHQTAAAMHGTLVLITPPQGLKRAVESVTCQKIFFLLNNLLQWLDRFLEIRVVYKNCLNFLIYLLDNLVVVLVPETMSPWFHWA